MFVVGQSFHSKLPRDETSHVTLYSQVNPSPEESLQPHWKRAYRVLRTNPCATSSGTESWSHTCHLEKPVWTRTPMGDLKLKTCQDRSIGRWK